MTAEVLTGLPISHHVCILIRIKRFLFTCKLINNADSKSSFFRMLITTNLAVKKLHALSEMTYQKLHFAFQYNKTAHSVLFVHLPVHILVCVYVHVYICMEVLHQKSW